MDLDKYFDLNYFILKVAGVWMPNKKTSITKRLLYYSYNTFWIVYCVLLYQPTESAVMFQTWDFLIIVRSLRDQFNHLICIYKLYVWFTKRKLILYIIKMLQSKRFVYDDDEYINAKEIIRKHKRVAEFWAKIFLLGVNFICLNMCFSVLYLFIFRSNEQYKMDDTGNLIYAQDLYATIITPFKITKKVTYILTFLFEILALDIYGWMIIGMHELKIFLRKDQQFVLV